MRPRIVRTIKFGWDSEGDYTIESYIEIDGVRSNGPRISINRELADKISTDILTPLYEGIPLFGDRDHVYEEVISGGSTNQPGGGKS
jgi:hypothetical protein